MKDFAVNFLLGFCLCFTTIELFPGEPSSHEVTIFDSDGDNLSTRHITVYDTDVPDLFDFE